MALAVLLGPPRLDILLAPLCRLVLPACRRLARLYPRVLLAAVALFGYRHNRGVDDLAAHRQIALLSRRVRVVRDARSRAARGTHLRFVSERALSARRHTASRRARKSSHGATTVASHPQLPHGFPSFHFPPAKVSVPCLAVPCLAAPGQARPRSALPHLAMPAPGLALPCHALPGPTSPRRAAPRSSSRVPSGHLLHFVRRVEHERVDRSTVELEGQQR